MDLTTHLKYFKNYLPPTNESVNSIYETTPIMFLDQDYYAWLGYTKRLFELFTVHLVYTSKIHCSFLLLYYKYVQDTCSEILSSTLVVKYWLLLVTLFESRALTLSGRTGSALVRYSGGRRFAPHSVQ